MISSEKFKQTDLAELARVRASFCSFLAFHFNEIVDIAFVKQIREIEPSFLNSLKNTLDFESDVRTGASLMLSYINETSKQDISALAENLGVEKTRLYRGVSPSYGPPPPYEAVWNGPISDTKTLQTLAEEYRHADLILSPDLHERLDYIGIELDFIRAMSESESEAWESDPDMAWDLLKSQIAFANNHLSNWVPAFIEKALSFAETNYFKGHLIMLRGFIFDLANIQTLI
jgi:TorA maturation chaperone TorD